MRVTPIFLGLALAASLVAPALAQQQPSGPQSLQCDAFTKNSDGDWVAKKAMMLPGPDGQTQVSAGAVLSDDMQDSLDAQCSK